MRGVRLWRVDTTSEITDKLFGLRPPPSALAFQLRQNLFRPLVHLARHTGELGNVDAVALVGSTGDNLVQEDDFAFPFFNSNIQIRHTR